MCIGRYLMIITGQFAYFSLALRNTPMQYAAIFKGCENGNFQMKNCDIFLIFAQNIDCEAVLTSTHNLCFRAKIRKNECIPL